MPTTTSDGKSDSTLRIDAIRDAIEELDQRFVGHTEDELMMRLKEVVREHITRPQHDPQHDDDQ